MWNAFGLPVTSDLVPSVKTDVKKDTVLQISNLELKDPMSVSLSITFKTFKFLTLFVALVGTIDAGDTGGGFKGSGPPPPPAQTEEI